MKTYKVSFRPAAITDLDELFVYIANHSSWEIADSYLARIESLCLSLRTFPIRGAAVPGRISGLRITGFEHRASILFRVGESEVEVLRILYGGQDLGPALERLLAIP